ncbi:hypothetical protein AN0003.2 [Aspergillus nidulans FGSC A4]|nr:hypothetical protein AN0003.2 [Aspergillus nidulans FGSC A4]|eukprot:XP_647835.1 hypothetical protein AN0003.2 [Aspergillus nidulans FGSC A4]
MEEESVALLLQQLQELCTEMRTQKQQLQEENNSLRAELQAVQNSQLRNHPPVTTTVTSATPTPYERSYPRPRHPDVEPFTGEDPKDYPPFQMNLRTKFAINAACYPTEEEQVYYAYSCLRGKASQRVLPWLLARQKSETPVLWAEFSAVLDKAFGDPDQQRKALVRVNTMKQGKCDFEEFLNKFDEELLNAGGINWDDNQKKALLDTAINVELLKAHAGGSDRTGTPDQIDWEATHAQIAALQKEVAALRTKGTRTPRKASQAPAEEKQKRLSEGKCLCCGDPDHFIQECPTKPTRRPRQVATVQEEQDQMDDYNTGCLTYGVQLDIRAHTEKGAYFYVIPDNLGYDLILGLPWLEQHNRRKYSLNYYRKALSAWFTKLDVSAAFYKIYIAKGQEWMTAFCTRYGLFEWLVTPFGLANVPSTFQKYINWTLREYLDEFCSAYIDDVLVYTNRDLRQHRKVSEDSWGFANFYQRFIPNFSGIIRPLNNLTKKGTPFL